MDPIIGATLINTGANILGGLLGGDKKAGGMTQAGYDAGKPYAEQAYQGVQQLQPYSPPVNWQTQPTFQAPRASFGGTTANIQPLNQSGAFSGIQPYDPRQELAKAGGTPDTTGMWAGVEPYNPATALDSIGPPPSLQEMLDRGTINESAFERIQIDPKLRELQMRALGKLQEIADNDGMTIQDRVRLRESMDTVSRQARMQRYAIMQNMEARGLSGSGTEIAMALAAHQAEVEGLSVAGSEAAARGEERAFQATISAGQMAGEIAQQDWQREAQKASALDAIATFNASQSMKAIQADYENRLQLGQAYATAGQQYFSNWMNVTAAKENAAQKSYEYRFQMAQAFAAAGQNWFENTVNLSKLTYQANQDAYENYFQWARSMDDYAVQQYDANFRAVKSEYDSYMEKLKLWEDQSRFTYGAAIDLAKTKSAAARDYGNYLSQAPGGSSGSGGMSLGLGTLVGGMIGGVGGAITGSMNAVTGAVKKVGSFIGGLFSDDNLKKNVNYDGGSIHNVPSVIFQYKAVPGLQDGWYRGVLAQDVEMIAPHLVDYSTGYRTVHEIYAPVRIA